MDKTVHDRTATAQARRRKPFMSPLNQRRWQNFKANRRGYWSLWIFLVLFVGMLATSGLGRLAPARLCAVAEVAVAAGTVAVVATMGAGSWALYVALALRGIAEGMARGTRFAVLREAATGGDVARLSAAVGGAQQLSRRGQEGHAHRPGQ